MDQQSNKPSPCAQKGCDFFGNPHTANFCSKHFKDFQKSMEKQEASVNTMVSAMTTTTTTSSPTPTQTTVAHEQQTNAPVLATSTTVDSATMETISSATAAAAATTPVVLKDETSATPTQKDPSRCASCNKRVGFLGFKCHCELVFCSNHRYGDQHECTFDYHKAHQQKLTVANPKVAAAKITKI